jgi:hypothetical protein
MIGPGGKCWKMQTAEEVENSHLPCAGIILFRFYGYYLSLFPIAFRRLGFQHPGNFKYRFSAGNTKIYNRTGFARIK